MADGVAASKLRMVLDYVPCEACLAHPVSERDQELLCSVCRRLDREVGARIAVRTTILVERPSEPAPAAPVVIPPAPAPAEAPRVDVRFVPAGERAPKPRGAEAIEILLEPYVEPSEAPPAAVAAAPAAPASEFEPVTFDDIVDYQPTSDLFDYTPGEPAAARSAAAAPPPPPPEPAEPTQDEFVFRPPPVEEPARETERASDEPVEDWMPSDEAPILEEKPAEPVEDAMEAPVLSAEPPAEPEPRGDSASDLWRLRGFDREAEERLAAAGVTAIAHLAGQEPSELADRTGLGDRVAPWVHVADLTQDVGVPLDAALALVAAGIEGPRDLSEQEPDAIVERVRALGGEADLSVKDVKRWKRRA